MSIRVISETTVEVSATGDRNVAALRHVVDLAIQKWHESPAVQLKGNPDVKRAGLVGQEAHDVEAALQALAHAVGIGPVDLTPNFDAGVCKEPESSAAPDHGASADSCMPTIPPRVRALVEAIVVSALATAAPRRR